MLHVVQHLLVAKVDGAVVQTLATYCHQKRVTTF
jgi:hypothetical protein